MSDRPRTFLFLQGPISHFFPRLADLLEAANPSFRVLRINLNVGDWLFWRRPGAINYRGRLEAWPDFIEAFIAEHGVTDVLLLGEQRDYHKAAAAAATRHGAQVIATDFGYLRPDWITFELDGLTGASRFPRDPDAVRALARATPKIDFTPLYRDPFWSTAGKDILYHMSASLFWFLYPFYQTHHKSHPVATYLGSGLRMLLQNRRTRHATAEIAAAEAHAGPVFVLPLQMARDFSIRAYSRFEGLEAAIEEIVASFARHAPADARLVVKVHPLDPGLTNWRKILRGIAGRHGVDERAIYIDGGDLARLFRAADGVVVVNSTAGLTALQLGAPTIALGQAIYDIPGMTAGKDLDAFWRAPTKPDAELVDDFATAIAGAVLVRGSYYSEPGVSAAAAGAAERLITGAVNRPLTATAAE